MIDVIQSQLDAANAELIRLKAEVAVTKVEVIEMEMKAKADIVVTRSEVEKAKAKVARTKEEIGKVRANEEELAGEAFFRHIEGYEVALSYVRAIFLKLDLSAFGSFKEIKDDELVDPTEENRVE